MATLPTYVVVTPARNEAQFIELTIKSVIRQTVRPLRWVIVSDGSTDRTDDIVASYARQHTWIELLRLAERQERSFASKVHAFNSGLDRLADLQYDLIGCLDGDVSFEADYFSFLLGKLAEDSSLCLVGTPYKDPVSPVYDYRFVSVEHVTGPCQLFRRECFVDIGGYQPLKNGAVDRIADISARMKGWKTRTFPEKLYLHHRSSGTAQRGILLAKFRDGAKDYSVGSSVLWELFRAVYQITRPPYIVGGLMLACGYACSAARHLARPVSPEFVRFCRHEQMQRLRTVLTRYSPARSALSHSYTPATPNGATRPEDMPAGRLEFPDNNR